uniref:Uncharacterized protein n=1 Tax=Phocoena sinus TaxID=42100 RepID=A0A8C9B4D2_PHOSS
ICYSQKFNMTRDKPFKISENSGSKCVISMHSRTTTIIQDPKNPEHTKTFTFDLAYWSHNGFQKDKDGVFISADPSSKFAGQVNCFKTTSMVVFFFLIKC